MHITQDKGREYPNAELRACPKFSREHFIQSIKVKGTHRFHHRERKHEGDCERWKQNLAVSLTSLQSCSECLWMTDNQPGNSCLLIHSLPPGSLCKEIKEGICALMSLSSLSLSRAHGACGYNVHMPTHKYCMVQVGPHCFFFQVFAAPLPLDLLSLNYYDGNSITHRK